MTLLQIQDNRDVVVVSFTQSQLVDETAIRQIGQEFQKLTTEAAADRRLLLDFAKVAFMASAMIGQIVRLNKHCDRDKVELKLCGISPNIMEVFTLMGLNKLLEIHRDQSQALKAFGPSRRNWNGKG